MPNNNISYWGGSPTRESELAEGWDSLARRIAGNLRHLERGVPTDPELFPIDEELSVEENLRNLPQSEYDQVIGNVFDSNPVSGLAALATKGMRPARMRNLYHGAKEGEWAKDEILRKGFTEGASSELKIPGTSLSRDPLVSSELFGNRDISNVLKVSIMEDAANIRNLRPSEYFTGKTPDSGFYGKPQATMRESELYALRGEREHVLKGSSLNKLKEQILTEQKRLRGIGTKLKETIAKRQDMVNAAEGGEYSLRDSKAFWALEEQEARLRRYANDLQNKLHKKREIIYGADDMAYPPASGERLTATVTKKDLPKVKTRELTAKEKYRIGKQQSNYRQVVADSKFYKHFMDDIVHSRKGSVTENAMGMPTDTRDFDQIGLPGAIWRGKEIDIDSSQISNKVIKDKLRDRFKRLNALKENKAMWERSIVGTGGDFRKWDGTLEFLRTEDYYKYVLEPAGYNKKALDKLKATATKLDEKIKQFETLSFEKSELAASKTLRDHLDNTYREYKVLMQDTMNQANKVFGVE
jgi:hypothetical protein